jgi:Na+/proline symporter
LVGLNKISYYSLLQANVKSKSISLTMQTQDYIVFIIYFLAVAGYGLWVYRRKKAGPTNSTQFFLAEGQLTWWAIGASLIASNISAEQFIGMSGNGFRLGMAIASYEWLAAVSLVIVAVFFHAGVFEEPHFHYAAISKNAVQ